MLVRDNWSSTCAKRDLATRRSPLETSRSDRVSSSLVAAARFDSASLTYRLSSLSRYFSLAWARSTSASSSCLRSRMTVSSIFATTSPAAAMVPTSATSISLPVTSAASLASLRLTTVPGTMVSGAIDCIETRATRTLAAWAPPCANARDWSPNPKASSGSSHTDFFILSISN